MFVGQRGGVYSVCSKYSPIDNLSPHSTLSMTVYRTMDHTMDCGLEPIAPPPPPPRIGMDRGSEVWKPLPPCLVPSRLRHLWVKKWSQIFFSKFVPRSLGVLSHF